VLTGADLLSCLEVALTLAGIGTTLFCAEIRIKSRVAL
jgi:hypothetical protein